MIIPIDFVAGAHGNFLEIVLNRFFGVVSDREYSFTSVGASHLKSQNYLNQRLFVAKHWFETPHSLDEYSQVISIQFDQDDLLLLSSVSLLRAGDMGIDNDQLEIDTSKKLDNVYYQSVLKEIMNAYKFLDPGVNSIPRNVLREFFKFGFKDPDINGYWKKQQQMSYTQPLFVFQFKAFYNFDLFVETLKKLEKFIGRTFHFCNEIRQLHEKFLSMIPYQFHKDQCDGILETIYSNKDLSIPKLTLLQESYLNAQLEKKYNKEMPFNDSTYFTSTADVLYYINTQAPNL
jgi:hypothetical protein